MELTLSDYADLIISKVYAGYKGVTNFSISKEAVEQEFILASRKLIKDLHKNQRLEPEEFFQVIPKIALKDLKELSDVPISINPDNKTGRVFYCDIPELLWVSGINPIDYVGPFNRFVQYVVKKGNSFVDHQYSKYHSKDPVVWVKGTKMYVINNLNQVTHIQLRAIFKDPTDLIKETDPFPIPSDAADILINQMAEQYVRFFRSRNPQVNSQNDIQPQAAEE
jgi:hypothetical protein